jgi:2-polyprenyl-6-methoxyphenol hydroxylase-like FAD-dependent oxidoreductase
MSNAKLGNRSGRHAVVIGAGMAGLLAARVLSEHFVRVTLVERDALPSAPAARAWAPQGQHAHVLAYKGQAILEQLFPNLFGAMGANGSIAVDLGSQMHWQHLGIVSTRARSGLQSQFQSPYALDWHLRRQVRSLDNICILERSQVIALRTNCNGEAIGGVEFRSLLGNDARTGVLTADLVVDAGGRASQLPRWLEALGYDRPAQTEIGVEFAYASRIYRRPRGFRDDWKVLLSHQDPSVGLKSVHIVPIEDDRWIVTVGARLGERVPTEAGGFIEFLRDLLPREAFDAVRQAEPLTPILSARFPSSQRRHYERLKRFPDCLIALGDALCSLNPIYGQGVTLCASQALALDRCLRRTRSGLARAARRFRADAALESDLPWRLAACEDFRYPQTSGERPAFAAWTNWYTRKVRELSATDPHAALALLEIMHMEAHPAALYRPSMMSKVLLTLLQPRRMEAPVHRGAASNASL